MDCKSVTDSETVKGLVYIADASHERFFANCPDLLAKRTANMVKALLCNEHMAGELRAFAIRCEWDNGDVFRVLLRRR